MAWTIPSDPPQLISVINKGRVEALRENYNVTSNSINMQQNTHKSYSFFPMRETLR